MKENPRWVPWRFRKLALNAFKEIEIRDFDNPNKPKKPTKAKKPKEFVTEISIPTIGQFNQYLGQRFLEIYGPRKLCSLIQRSSSQGPWAEKVVVPKKNKSGKVKKLVYSKLEHELFTKERIHHSHLSLSPKDLARYEELQVTMSPDLMAKSDNELLKICERWIDGFNEPDTPVSHV